MAHRKHGLQAIHRLAREREALCRFFSWGTYPCTAVSLPSFQPEHESTPSCSLTSQVDQGSMLSSRTHPLNMPRCSGPAANLSRDQSLLVRGTQRRGFQLHQGPPDSPPLDDIEEDEAALAGTPLHGKTYSYLRAEVVNKGNVGLITLARPKALNALSTPAMKEVLDALDQFDSMPEIGAMVITGEGKAFAAGADIKELKDQGFVDAYMGGLLSGWEAIMRVRKPVIAAVNGYALGGGCELAMMCDIILAGERAVFGQPEVNLGVLPGMGGTQRLTRAVGKSKAMEMVLTGGRLMDANDAVHSGLASRVVSGEPRAVVREAVAVAAKIATLSRPAIALAKEAVNAAFENSLREGLHRERNLFHAAFGLADKDEGMAAFVEKRPPHFQHK